MGKLKIAANRLRSLLDALSMLTNISVVISRIQQWTAATAAAQTRRNVSETWIFGGKGERKMESVLVARLAVLFVVVSRRIWPKIEMQFSTQRHERKKKKLRKSWVRKLRRVNFTRTPWNNSTAPSMIFQIVRKIYTTHRTCGNSTRRCMSSFFPPSHLLILLAFADKLHETVSDICRPGDSEFTIFYVVRYIEIYAKFRYL